MRTTDITPSLDISQKLRCRDCPQCLDNYPGKKNAEGVHFYICGMTGNKVYKDPWIEKRNSGGYFHHGAGSCGLYDCGKHVFNMTEAEKRRRVNERRKS